MRRLNLTPEKRIILFKLCDSGIFAGALPVRLKYIHMYDVDGNVKPHVCPTTWGKECPCCYENMVLWDKNMNEARKNLRRKRCTYCINVIYDSKGEFFGEEVFFTTTQSVDISQVFIDYVDEVNGDIFEDMAYKLVLDKKGIDLYNGTQKYFLHYDIDESRVIFNGEEHPFYKPTEFDRASLKNELKDLFDDACGKSKRIGISTFIKIVKKFIEDNY